MNLLKQFLRLVSPSFLSGTVSLLLAVGIVIAVLSPFLYKGSYLEQYGEAVRSYPGTFMQNYETIATQLNSSETVGNISIFFSWAIVGFTLYYLGLLIISLFINITTFSNILGYKNTDKKSFIRWAFERLAIRVASSFGLIAWASFGFYAVVPVVLTLIAAAYSSSIFMGGVYIIASLVFLAVSFHVSVILLRLVFLRPRIISWMYQPSDA